MTTTRKSIADYLATLPPTKHSKPKRFTKLKMTPVLEELHQFRTALCAQVRITNGEKVAPLIKVFSTTGPFPLSSELPRPPTMREIARQSCYEVSEQRLISKHYSGLKDPCAQGRFKARWNWWQYKDTQVQQYFERCYVGAKRTSKHYKIKDPKYYRAYWAEFHSLVMYHWQELDRRSIGLECYFYGTPNESKTYKDFNKFVDHFFAERRHEAVEQEHFVQDGKIISARRKKGTAATKAKGDENKRLFLEEFQRVANDPECRAPGKKGKLFETISRLEKRNIFVKERTAREYLRLNKSVAKA